MKLTENFFDNMVLLDSSILHFLGKLYFLMNIKYKVKTKRKFDSHMMRMLVYKKGDRALSLCSAYLD